MAKLIKQIVQQTVQQSVGREVLKNPIVLENQAKYQKNGLTYQSNNINIIPRDPAGNINLQENSTNNPLLIIEPSAEKILNNSVLKVIDTQFNYFKFPVNTNIINTDLDLDLDLDLSAPVQDPIYHLKIEKFLQILRDKELHLEY